MASLNLQQWVNKFKPQGKAAVTPQAKQAYLRWVEREKANAPAAAAPQVQPPQQKWTPGGLDEQGEREDAELRQSYEIDRPALLRQFADQRADLNAQLPQIQQARDTGYRAADSNAAARGMFNSGIRTQNRTEIGTEADRQTKQVQTGLDRLEADQKTATDRFDSGFKNAETGIIGDANARSQAAWNEANLGNSVVAANPAPKVKQQARKSYTQFLNGRKSTGDLARMWDKQYNYGQRFGGGN